MRHLVKQNIKLVLEYLKKGYFSSNYRAFENNSKAIMANYKATQDLIII